MKQNNNQTKSASNALILGANQFIREAFNCRTLVQGYPWTMVCSLRSTGAGRSEVVRLETNALELIPNVIFLQDITISHHGKISIGVESKFCAACRDKLAGHESACTDVGQLYKLLCDSCQNVLVDYAKTTLSASKSLLGCGKRCRASGEQLGPSDKKKIRTIPKSLPKSDLTRRESHSNLENFPDTVETSCTLAALTNPQKEPQSQVESRAASQPETHSTMPENTSVLVLLDDCKKDFRSECIPAHYGTAEIPTIFEKLLQSNIDWCRYCGTTNGVNWRPGPWGKKTLCNRHGCDFKGYGFAAHKPKLDLTPFLNEPLNERNIPIVKEYCMHCQSKISIESNPLVMCHGCPRSFHYKCYQKELGTVPSDCVFEEGKAWFCNAECRTNHTSLAIIIELPKRSMPFSIASNRSSPIKPKSFIRPIIRRPRSSCSSFLSSYRRSKEPVDSFTYNSELIGKLSQCPLETSHIQLPKWTLYESGNVLDDEEIEECTQDDVFIQRHLPFENLERNNKLLFGLHGSSTPGPSEELQ